MSKMSDFALFFIDDFGRFSKQNKKELDNLDFIFILFTVAPPIKSQKIRDSALRHLWIFEFYNLIKQMSSIFTSCLVVASVYLESSF